MSRMRTEFPELPVSQKILNFMWQIVVWFVREDHEKFNFVKLFTMFYWYFFWKLWHLIAWPSNLWVIWNYPCLLRIFCHATPDDRGGVMVDTWTGPGTMCVNMGKEQFSLTEPNFKELLLSTHICLAWDFFIDKNRITNKISTWFSG